VWRNSSSLIYHYPGKCPGVTFPYPGQVCVHSSTTYKKPQLCSEATDLCFLFNLFSYVFLSLYLNREVFNDWYLWKKISSGTRKKESFYLHLWVCMIRIEERKYLCTVSVLGKMLEQLYVLMRITHITYISAFQIMDWLSWRGWETEICWSELSSALWIGPALWLEATFTLFGQPNSWPEPNRHIIVPFASRSCSYWSVRCNNWESTARHCSQWTSSPFTPLVWLMDWKFTHLLRKQQKLIQTAWTYYS